MFNVDGNIYVRRFHAAKLLGIDHRTLRSRAAELGVKTIRLPGWIAEAYALADVERILAAAGKPEPAPAT